MGVKCVGLLDTVCSMRKVLNSGERRTWRKICSSQSFREPTVNVSIVGRSPVNLTFVSVLNLQLLNFNSKMYLFVCLFVCFYVCVPLLCIDMPSKNNDGCSDRS